MSAPNDRLWNALCLWLGGAVAAGALSTVLAAALTVHDVAPAFAFFRDLATTIAFLVLLSGAVWLLGRVCLGRGRALASAVLAAYSAFAVGVAWPILDSVTEDGGSLPALLAVVGALSAMVMALAIFRWSTRWDKSTGARAAALVAGAGLLAPVSAFVYWLIRYRIPGRSPQGIGALILWLLVVGIAGWVALSNRGKPRRVALVLALAGVALAPALSRWWELRPKGKTIGGTRLAPIVLIVVDTLRADRLGGVDPASDLTPRLDAFAARSTLFRSARSPAPWTRPAMASVLTGLSPLVHLTNQTGTPLPKVTVTLAERLAKVGYVTAAIGQNGNLKRFGFDQGFQEWNFFSGYLTRDHPSPGADVLRWLGHDPGIPDTRGMADRAIDWIERRGDEPFLLWLHIFDPHEPYEPLLSDLPPGEHPFPPSFGDDIAFRAGQVVLSDPHREWIRELYDAEVRWVDREVHRVLEALRANDLYDRSVVVLTSDHGEELFEHGSLEHGHTLYEELLRVPLIVKAPRGTGLKPGVVEQPVSTESIVPTVLELAGVPFRSTEVSQPSLVALMRGETVEAEPLLATGLLFYDDMVGIAHQGVKYTRRLRDGHEELYFLPEDPGELRSLVDEDPERLDTARSWVEAAVLEATQQRLALFGEAGNDGGEVELDAATVEELRALGYIQ